MTTLVSPLAHHVLASEVLAQCFGIAGCSAAGNQMIPFIITIATLLVEIAAGLSVVFVVVGGMMMLLSFGNESIATRGRTSVIFSLVGFAIVLISQAIVSFVVARVNLGLAGAPPRPDIALMEVFVRSALNIFNVSFALMCIYSGFRMVFSRGESGELDQTKKVLYYGVSGAILVNLAYALVNATVSLGF